MPDVRTTVRLALMKAGRRVTPHQLANLRSALSYLELGRWLNDINAAPQLVADDYALFSLALSKISGNKPLYLEFGVYAGRSMRWWSQHLPQQGANLIGFDSFEGLPEDWRPGFSAGQFATGQPPRIDDQRVSFQVGWFDDTLPKFQVPDHDQLIINIDSDLYSSAATVLQWAEPYFQPGTLIYFDEFADHDHEMRAFNELKARSLHDFQPIGVAHGGRALLFEVKVSTVKARPAAGARS
jgi:Methyltransferase domain